jgi:peptidoglycan-associated lipoprotein
MSDQKTERGLSIHPQYVDEKYKDFAAGQHFPDGNIHFEFDSARLLRQAKENLRRKAQWLMAHPDVPIIIQGHCDERGLTDYNLALGDQRANRVKNYLRDLGVSEKRMTTVSYGEELPVDPRQNEEAWAKNRRVQFR